MEFNRLGTSSGGVGHHPSESRELKTEQQAVDASAPSAALPLAMDSTLKTLLKGCAESGVTLFDLSRAIKRAYILLVLDRHKGNHSNAARALGMHRNTLSRTIDELDMRKDVAAQDAFRKGKR